MSLVVTMRHIDMYVIWFIFLRHLTVTPLLILWFCSGFWRHGSFVNIWIILGVVQSVFMFVTAVLILIFDKKIHDELAYVWLTSFASANANIGISSVIRVYGDAISNPLLLVLFIKIIYNLAIFCLRGVLNRIQIIDKSAISPPLFPSQLGEDLAVSAVYLSANLDGEFALTLIFTLTLTLIRDSGLLHEIHSRLVAHRGNITRSAAFMAKQYFVMQQDLVAGFLSAPTIFIIVR
mmetsp:Transcript_15048/g.28644  ORF Transcript_15048/g.28644 Transcript_15048/m.28644 type:complete len:235 (-) Transcript_15048:58-762(-)